MRMAAGTGKDKKPLDKLTSDIVNYNSRWKTGFLKADQSQPVPPANNPDFKENET
jgi:hypothetical protein